MTDSGRDKVFSATFRTSIKASFEKIWDTLLDEMEHPENYSSKIKKTSILERFAGGLLRQVSVPDADVREKFNYDYEKGLVSSHLVGHPHIVGILKKTISKDPKNPETHILESSLEWEATEEHVDAMLRRNVASFVMDSLEKVKIKSES